MELADLRKLRNTASDFSDITKALEKTNTSNSREDARFWKLDKDKAGNGTATIRFLPKTGNDELPWVLTYSHGFQGPTGKWYIEQSLSTIGEIDGIAELNRSLYSTSKDQEHPARKQASKQARRSQYIANVLIVNDPKHPELNGQVKLFKFGKKIFQKIMDKYRPTFEDETPVNIFHPYVGANFKLRMKQVDGFPNYDQSVFESESEMLDGDDDKILAALNAQFPLYEFIDPKNFKSREVLDKLLDSVLNGAPASSKTAESVVDDEEFDTPAKAKPQPVKEEKEKPSVSFDDDDGDFDIEKLKSSLKFDLDD